MVKGMIQTLELAFATLMIVFVIMFAFSSSTQKYNANEFPANEKIVRTLQFLDARGLLQNLTCANSTTSLEAELSDYFGFMFDTTICYDGNCTIYQVPPYGNVYEADYETISCDKKLKTIKVFVWQ